MTAGPKVLLHPTQVEFLNCTVPFAAFVGGIGSGKTFVLCYDLIRRARSGGLYMVLAPSYPMLRDVTIRSFFELTRHLGVRTEYVKSEHRCVMLRSRAEILFRSADNPETLRGPNLSGVSIDEASLVDPEVYDIAIGRLRQGRAVGFLRAAFTPKGPTHWTHAVFATGRQDTELFRSPTSGNFFLPAEFEATIRRQYGNTPWARQELEGEFVQPEGAFFPADWLDWPGLYVDAFPDAGVTRTLLYLDPSRGKDTKKGDDQAFVLAGWWPGPRNENLFYLECVATKEDVVAMVSRGVRLCRDRAVTHWHYETNGTMGLLNAEVRRQLKEATMPHVRPYGFDNTGNKQQRIRNAFEPYLKNRQLRIVDTAGGRLLAAQLSDCPFATHDDCSDAGAGAITELEKLISRG